MFKNKQIIGGTVIAGALAVVTLIAPAMDTSVLANTASANYGGGGVPRIELCQNGRTIRVAKRAESALIAQGATRGACQPGQVLGTATTSPEQAQQENLQRQVIALLQQLIALLQNQN